MHIVFIGRGECYEGNVTLSRLMHGLFLNYDKEMRPVRNNSDIVTVEFGMALRAVINIEETDQTLTSSVWVRQVLSASTDNPLFAINLRCVTRV